MCFFSFHSTGLRVNFEHKVLLLLEVRDGVEHVAHGEDGAAVRPSVLHVRRALLGVVEQHATWKRREACDHSHR